MHRLMSLALIVLAACAAPEAPAQQAAAEAPAQQAASRPQMSIDQLVADAPGYVAARYQRSELPAALIADLTAQDFQCQHSATVSECGSSRHAFASCFDVVTVRITEDAVSAQQNRRCMGVTPPPHP